MRACWLALASCVVKWEAGRRGRVAKGGPSKQTPAPAARGHVASSLCWGARALSLFFNRGLTPGRKVASWHCQARERGQNGRDPLWARGSLKNTAAPSPAAAKRKRKNTHALPHLPAPVRARARARLSTSSHSSSLPPRYPSGIRCIVTVECTEARPEGLTPTRYTTQKNRKNTPERLELMKYNKYLKRHTLHREVK